MEILTIGQVAKKAAVNIETIRYYERRGLIPEPPRQESGYRQYTSGFVERIQFIKRAQALGFSLDEISQHPNVGGCCIFIFCSYGDSACISNQNEATQFD